MVIRVFHFFLTVMFELGWGFFLVRCSVFVVLGGRRCGSLFSSGLFVLGGERISGWFVVIPGEFMVPGGLSVHRPVPYISDVSPHALHNYEQRTKNYELSSGRFTLSTAREALLRRPLLTSQVEDEDT
jgi:hypothetical protein